MPEHLTTQGRVDLWKESWNSIIHSPIIGNGYGTYQLGQHAGGLRDTHNWYVKVMEETGLVGLFLVFALFQQMLASSFRLFRRANDPLYRGLGLGLFLAMCSSMVSNCFGDRWTYLEITGLLFVLAGAMVRANHLMALDPTQELTPIETNLRIVRCDMGRQ